MLSWNAREWEAGADRWVPRVTPSMVGSRSSRRVSCGLRPPVTKSLGA